MQSRWYRNLGTSSDLWPSQTMPRQYNIERANLDVGDIDGDGDEDVATVGYTNTGSVPSGGNITVWLNSGLHSGRFLAPSQVIPIPNSASLPIVLVSDLDLDGDGDLLYSVGGIITGYFWDSNSISYQYSGTVSLTQNITSMIFADVDNDTYQDLIVATQVNVWYFINLHSSFWFSSSVKVADYPKIGRAVQQECRDRSRMPSSA
eukprot:TRINITY_DN41401_c0_g1_i1.p1 TRINITY_DN41401_c0_g1~~TRINITY_DN41401_c0_g1_i1.p1  ORF type:complete len:205 (-),score=20.00 TRINITY_DN41401_c0_g1_i1:11-625(-)